jgi:hypothetical protein
MKRLWMSGAAAMMAMSIASVGAQTPQTQSPTQTPQTQQPATSMQDTMNVTVQGCVYKEADIPGRNPNVAERAGVLEDYILVASPDPSSATAGTTGTTPPTGTAGTSGSMASTTGNKAYKLEKIADERLSAMVGKRVEVTGHVEGQAKDRTSGTSGYPTTGAAQDKTMSRDQTELPEFEVTTIREVEGTCPATPQIRK